MANGKVTLSSMYQLMKDVGLKVDKIDCKVDKINDRTIDQEARLRETEKKIDNNQKEIKVITKMANDINLTVAKFSVVISLVVAGVTSFIVTVVHKLMG